MKKKSRKSYLRKRGSPQTNISCFDLVSQAVSFFFLWVLLIVLSFMAMPVICHAHSESRINTDFCYSSIIYSLRLFYTFLPRLCSIAGH